MSCLVVVMEKMAIVNMVLSFSEVDEGYTLTIPITVVITLPDEGIVFGADSLSL